VSEISWHYITDVAFSGKLFFPREPKQPVLEILDMGKQKSSNVVSNGCF